MIRSFKDRRTKAIDDGVRTKGIGPDLTKIARRKLKMVAFAVTLDDLRYPPGNHLEALHRGRKGQHSIRINDQFRVCFRWIDGAAEDVEVTDYHDEGQACRAGAPETGLRWSTINCRRFIPGKS